MMRFCEEEKVDQEMLQEEVLRWGSNGTVFWPTYFLQHCSRGLGVFESKIFSQNTISMEGFPGQDPRGRPGRNRTTPWHCRTTVAGTSIPCDSSPRSLTERAEARLSLREEMIWD